MKKIHYYISILLVIFTLSACMNDFDNEAVSTDEFTASNVGEVNTTISKIRSKYASVISSSSVKKVTDNLVFEGIVTGNDISGNLYQQIIVQEMNEDGTVNTSVPGISVGIKGIGGLFSIFPIGQVVRVSLKDLYIGGYGAMAKVGMPYLTTTAGAQRMGPMTAPFMQTNIQKVGTPNPDAVVARELSSSDVKSTSNIDNLTPMLVCVKNVYIDDADGMTTYAQYSGSGTTSITHNLVFTDGTRLQLSTSSAALFAADVMPTGKYTMYGVLTRYSSSFQFQLRDLNDIITK